MSQKGTLLHVFLDCPKLRDLWKMVEQTIKTVTGVSYEVDPDSMIPPYLLKSKYSLLWHLLTPAQACIPALWKQPSPPC